MSDDQFSAFHLAERLDRMVQADPRAAIEEANVVLEQRELDDQQSAIAHATKGRALFELGRLPAAVTSMRRALVAAGRTQDDRLAGSIAMSAAAILAEGGSVDEGLSALAELASRSSGAELGRLEMQRSYVLHQAGRLSEAITSVGVAEDLLRDSGDSLGLLRMLLHRGLVLLQQGQFDRSMIDFEEAEKLAVDLGQAATRAMIVANQAVVLGRSRRLREARNKFDEAQQLYVIAGSPHRSMAIMEIDRAEVMLHAGLVVDAIEACHAAVDLVAPTGNTTLLGDAELMLARAELAGRRWRGAVVAAGAASRTFESAGRVDMITHAQAIDVCARLGSARDRDDVSRQLRRAADLVVELRRRGWESLASNLMLERVRVGRRTGTAELIRDDIEELRRGISSGERGAALAGWFAEAVGRELEGASIEAAAACHDGLSVLDDIVAEAESLEARSAALATGGELSQLLIDLAVERGDAATVFGAAEGTRARALHEGLTENERYEPLTESGAGELSDELARRLGPRTLVEWIVTRGEVWAVLLGGGSGRNRLERVGSYREIVRARDRLMVWFDLAASEPEGSSERAQRAARILDDLIIAPLGLPADNGVVVVPVDLLHGIPWSGLPSLAGRPLALAPNAQVWLDADRRALGSAGSVGMTIGPDLDSADVESTMVARHHEHIDVATGADATFAVVASMLGRCDLVHLAAHGTFRSDHPLLSTIRLADGDATMYDAVPELVRSRLVVLSSCEGGAQGTSDGSEVLGLSSVLLARGAAGVLAPLTRVRELECAEFVAEVHGELVAGEPFACAVAAVRQRWLTDDDLSRWAVASSFTCFGSGAVNLVHRA